MSRLDEFQEFRLKMNEKILATEHLGIKRARHQCIRRRRCPGTR